MLILRCTQKLRNKKPGPISDADDNLTPTLDSWHANLIRLAHSPVVLCVNDKSLLAILVPGKDFSNFVFRFRERLLNRLIRIGLSDEMLRAENAAMQTVRIEPSNSKSVLASMNNFVQNLKYDVGDRFNFLYADELEDRLSEIPMGALKYQIAIEVAMTAFKTEKIREAFTAERYLR